MSLPTESPVPSPSRPSLGLLLFAIFPIIGLIAALGLMLSNQASNTAQTIPTPAAVTLPPIPSPAPVVGAPVLDFELEKLNSGGETARLSDYAGRVVFLNFWATWCEPCQRELPALQAFSQEQAALGDDGAVVLTVNGGELESDVNTYLRAHGITDLTVLLDRGTEITEMYGVFQIPVTFVIDTNGNVRYPHYGEISRDDIDGYLTALGEG
jgi:peroxiredoxin